ncbi:uroporphyrinogen decarboxylase family protein [Vallitalea okinawensis]|uniref:uroporphyrinogen decarboxylase family protein n=1 Tax=Vallitalea okinawensis TaxID=2078660 RepID=UPI000CFA966B|nr:uroporphyrinogen decarboxylase family protein [Vallitalea okinawensis]
MLNSRELVYKTLNFENPIRAPRQLWKLPWADDHYPEEVKRIEEDFPTDFDGPPGYHEKQPHTEGNPYEIGEYVDEWGCKFINKQKGIIGEVKEPLVKEDDWADAKHINIPEEWLTINQDKINAYCNKSSKFLMAGCCPRPFERLQFIRGTENLYIDLMMRPKKMFGFIEEMHDFYCRLLTKWAQTDVDALSIMDDWGAQNSLLINPKMWVEIFKPLYKDYIDIAHQHGKKIFMHSDGYILDIYPHLIDLGLDAINSQIFCMGIDQLKQFKGHITFWGEMDRQYLLARGTTQEVEEAVTEIKEKLWHNGGCIAQLEFGAGAKPENVYTTYDTWNKLFK